MELSVANTKVRRVCLDVIVTFYNKDLNIVTESCSAIVLQTFQENNYKSSCCRISRRTYQITICITFTAGHTKLNTHFL